MPIKISELKKVAHWQHCCKEAAHDVCAVYGDGAIAERTAQDWHAKFKNGNFDLKDVPRSGRPVEFGEGRLNQLLHEIRLKRQGNLQRK